MRSTEYQVSTQYRSTFNRVEKYCDNSSKDSVLQGILKFNVDNWLGLANFIIHGSQGQSEFQKGMQPNMKVEHFNAFLAAYKEIQTSKLTPKDCVA